MTHIFLPVEITNRELDYKINLARHFCIRGLTVLLGYPPFLRDELKYKNYRAIFIEKGLNPDPKYYSQLAQKGVFLYDLSDEGVGENIYSINHQPAVDALKTMRKIFLWGETQKQDLMKKNPLQELTDKYCVVGNPGFDLCMPKYKEFHKKLKPKNFPKSYILVNTNFGCFMSHGIEEHLKACTLHSPETEQLIRNGYQKEEHQFIIFRNWLESIIQSFPHETFIIRPHPTEIQEKYKKIFGKYKNTLISKEGNANQAIASAKVVLHKDCSTALQCYLMGIPAISLGDESLYKEYAQWPLSFSALPKTLEHAKKLISQILLKGKLDQELQSTIDAKAKKTLNKYFSNIGKSSKNLVEFIIQDAQELLKIQTPYQIIDSRTKWHKLKLFIRKFLPLHYKLPIAVREILLKFTKNDVLQRLELLEHIDFPNIKFSVENISPNVFRITKK